MHKTAARAMDRPLRVLIVEDSAADTALLVTSLQEGGYDLDWTRVDRAQTMKAALDGGPWHEEALRESEERYRELVENANDIVLSIDLNATFTSLNRAGDLISGYSREELYGRNIRFNRQISPAGCPGRAPDGTTGT